MQADSAMCMRCYKMYAPSKNHGTWSCKIHPGMIDDNGRWTCCKQKYFFATVRVCAETYEDVHGRGCRACDHSNTLSGAQGVVPLNLQNYRLVPSRALVVIHSFQQLDSLNKQMIAEIGKGINISNAPINPASYPIYYLKREEAWA